jgi:hypothetical protein
MQTRSQRNKARCMCFGLTKYCLKDRLALLPLVHNKNCVPEHPYMSCGGAHGWPTATDMARIGKT